MSRNHVNHSAIMRFAEERVNLKRDDAIELRRQANMLRDKLKSYLAQNPDFDLKKMLLSGSLAKGHRPQVDQRHRCCLLRNV